jgi:hypothetical protein
MVMPDTMAVVMVILGGSGHCKGQTRQGKRETTGDFFHSVDSGGWLFANVQQRPYPVGVVIRAMPTSRWLPG